LNIKILHSIPLGLLHFIHSPRIAFGVIHIQSLQDLSKSIKNQLKAPKVKNFKSTIMKITNLFILLGGAFLFSAASCNDDEAPVADTTNMTLNFRATFGDSPFLLLTEDFMLEDGKAVRFQEEFGFFISDIVLLQAVGNDQVDLKEIEYLDFGANSTPALAEEPFTITIENIPVGDYRGIKFNIGVPSDLNEQKPSDFGSSNALGNENTYWNDWSSYTFLRFDGCYDRDGNGIGTSCNTANGDNTRFTFHTGPDEAFRDVSAFLRPITLTKGVNSELNFEIDAAEILGTGSNAIDFGDTQSIHTNNISDPVGLALRDKLMDNLAQRAITLIE